MKQVSAVQSSLERANRVMLHNHLETCFSAAVLDGRGQAAIDELVDAIKFTPALTGPLHSWAVRRLANPLTSWRRQAAARPGDQDRGCPQRCGRSSIGREHSRWCCMDSWRKRRPRW